MTDEIKKKVILDLCGGTGAWSRPYVEAGYDVRVITLPTYDITEIFNESEYSMRFSKIIGLVYTGKVYGILAAPPCTMFSTVRTTAKKPRDLREGMKTVEACLKIIWEAQYVNKLAFWALENPRGLLQRFLGRPRYEFDPTEFGEKQNKKTQLWGYFNEPVKTHEYKKTESHAITNEFFEVLPDDYIRDPNMRLDAIKRSITPKGFAEAFFKANL